MTTIIIYQKRKWQRAAWYKGDFLNLQDAMRYGVSQKWTVYKERILKGIIEDVTSWIERGCDFIETWNVHYKRYRVPVKKTIIE